MKKIDLALSIGLAASILLTSFTAFARDCDEIRGSVVRLHILANSDSVADQELKLEVRDAVLKETADLFVNSYTKQQAEDNVAKRLGEIETIARKVIMAKGYDYEAKAELVNMFFETRAYGDIVMPAGRYDAVRIKIGSAKGKNWWCVMFPPMCVPAAAEKPDTPSMSGAEEQIRMLGQQPKYVPKLAILEIAIKITQDKADETLATSGETQYP